MKAAQLAALQADRDPYMGLSGPEKGWARRNDLVVVYVCPMDGKMVFEGAMTVTQMGNSPIMRFLKSGRLVKRNELTPHYRVTRYKDARSPFKFELKADFENYEVFEVWEHGEAWCRGIVFDLKEIDKPKEVK